MGMIARVRENFNTEASFSGHNTDSIVNFLKEQM
jgi:hypothetical protein